MTNLIALDCSGSAAIETTDLYRMTYDKAAAITPGLTVVQLTGCLNQAEAVMAGSLIGSDHHTIASAVWDACEAEIGRKRPIWDTDDEFAWMDGIFTRPVPDEHLGQRLARELGSVLHADDAA